MQTGNRKVVKTIITIDRPSTAKTTELVEKVNQLNSSKNWKSKQKESKDKQITIEILNTKSVQTREKFLMKKTLFLLTKNNKKAPNAGSKQKRNNIKFQKFRPGIEPARKFRSKQVENCYREFKYAD